MKKCEDNFEKEKVQLQSQIDKLTDNYNQTTLDLKNTKDELEHLKSDSKATITKLTKENNDMQAENQHQNRCHYKAWHRYYDRG